MRLTGCEFEQLLHRGLVEAICVDWADVLQGDGECPTYSARYCRRRDRLLAHPACHAWRRAYSHWWQRAKMVAWGALILAILAGGLLAASPRFRAWICRVIWAWREGLVFTGLRG